MSEVWPHDAKLRISRSASSGIRPFKCLLLMPFESRFNEIAKIIENTVIEGFKGIPDNMGMLPPSVNRLDWVTTSGVIQQQIWQEILESDIIFCDITGYNPNVIFECGVCAAWKDIKHVIFIKDKFFKQQSAFDLAPIRYADYEMTSDGLTNFSRKIVKLISDVIIAYPDGQGEAELVTLPLNISFKSNIDDLRIYTPPFAHRRVIDGGMEFGSLYAFPHSWATVGKKPILNFSLEFSAKFASSIDDNSYIGVGLRSQHYYANLGHILYMTRSGRIILTQPNETPPNFYTDIILREKTDIDVNDYHEFLVIFDTNILSIKIGFFEKCFRVSEMPKVFGPGLIRFQAYTSWMKINYLYVAET